MNYLQLSLLMIAIVPSQTSAIVYLDNCTYALDVYQQYLNLLWSSDDSRTLHIQAVYSLTSNHSLVPGHIYTYLSQSVALIPFLVQCTYPENLSWQSYLPFTQCSSTISTWSNKKNYESTRTYLNIRTMPSMKNAPLLYTGEYHLLLFNCSFQFKSVTYQLKPTDLFTFRIEYEHAIDEQNVSSCRQCNQRTSLCRKNRCACRTGTLPVKLYQENQYCIDTTSNCTYDLQRCLTAQLTTVFSSRANQRILLLTLILVLAVLFLGVSAAILCCVCRKTSKHTFNKKRAHPSDPSIYMIHRHERTPSTISTTDSMKLSDCQPSTFANEYVSTFYDDYPKIITDQTHGEVVLILA